ncbi:MAG TPA: alpha/beta fold hydrolase [Trueperaceae bacterium]|nr:alpha/beta fold hydrolase [Trueperaceae bacterium]
MAAGQPQKFTFSTATGAALVGYHWSAGTGTEGGVGHEDVNTRQGATTSSKPPLVMVHGFAEHARRHADLAAAAAVAGHEVYGFDLAGHGESHGRRAVVVGYEAAMGGIDALLDRVGSSAILFGHSMGGAIALSYALANPRRLSGLVLSAPALMDAVKRPAWLLSLSGPIARLAPTLPVAQLDVSRISRDHAEVERYRSDPLIHHGGVPAATGYTITSQGQALLGRAGALEVPTLVVHGEADGIIDVEGSRRLAASSREGMVQLFTVPGAFHEMHHDPLDSGVPQLVRERILGFIARPAAA